MIGIETKWECPSCGNMLKSFSPFWDKQHRKKVDEPKKCGCGKKGGFNLLGVSQCEFTVVPEGYVLTEEKNGN